MVSGVPASLEGPSSCGPEALERARRLLRQPATPSEASFRDAEQLLERCLSSDPTGEVHAALGLAQFLQEKYGDAVLSLRVACSRQPANPHWKDLLAHTERNAVTRFDLGKGTPAFDRDKLLSPPALWITAPADLEPLPAGPGLVRMFFRGFNKFLGIVTAPLFLVIVRIVGRHGPEKTWELWPKDRWHVLKDLRLAAIRDYMNRKTQQNPYTGHLVGFQTPGQKRPEWTERYRTATGAWNTDNPMEGAAGTRFVWQGRDPAHTVRRDRLHDKDLPNPIAVANLIFRCEGAQQTAPFLNLLTIGWIQFMVHDWLNHRQSLDPRDTIAIELPRDDPRRDKYGQDYMFFRRTLPSIAGEPFAFENEVTAWWDGSQIYGSDQATQDRLRQTPGTSAFLEGGKLRVDEDGLLPLDAESRVIESGFTRNMWVGLELFHTVFVKHHNYLCELYKKEHPSWSSDQVFHHARLENTATIAKIHSIEWTPAVLPTKELALGMAANWHGMVEGLLRRFERRRPLRLLEIANPVLGGVIGGTLNNFGIPQNFSEQFAEVYRLHSGMPDALEIRAVGADVTRAVPTELTRAANSHATLAEHGLATMLNSFGWQHMPALINNNHPAFMTDMSTEGNPVLDLAAADIVRARERGIPPFNEFRRQIGMAPLSWFEDLGCDARTVARLESLYGTGRAGVERMDLIVGMHCDMNRPLRGFDQTRFAIFLQAASRRLQTDPFYTTKYDAQHYTASGLARIDEATLKSVLLRHCPELARSGLMGVNNAFEPWGTTADTHPAEHPLTVYAERYVTKHPGRRAAGESA
jgi:hypothetical protein